MLNPVRFVLVALAIHLLLELPAQNIGINASGAAPDPSALLDIDGNALPSNGQRGLLIPRVFLQAANLTAPIAGTPAVSLMVYNMAVAGVPPNNVVPGFYYWSGTQWLQIGGSATNWSLVGNAGTNPLLHFIGTTDAADWTVRTGGNTAGFERYRVTSAGRIIANSTSGSNSDVLSVYAALTPTPMGTSTSIIGERAVCGYSAGTVGTGIFGQTTTTTATTSSGVYGLAASGIGLSPGTGVRGESVLANGVGVLGITNTSNANINSMLTTPRAIHGQLNANSILPGSIGIAVSGLVNTVALTGEGRGVQGQSPTDDGQGVIGFNTSVLGSVLPGVLPTGVWGQVASPYGAGVVGNAPLFGGLGYPIGTLGTTSSDAGTGVFGQSTSTGPSLTNPVGTTGEAASLTGFGVEGYNLHLQGTGVLGEGNNLVGTYLATGSGGAFTGSGTGSFNKATTAASGTGVIGVGNNGTGSTLVQGSGGAFTGSFTGAFGSSTAPIGTGVVGAGNNLTATTLLGGSGGAFTGSNTGSAAFGQFPVSTGQIGAGNGIVAPATLANGSGGAFTGTTTGAFGLGNLVANGIGVIGVGNNGVVPTPVAGAGGAFSGAANGVYALSTTVASGTGVVAMGNNTAPSTLAGGSGVAGTGANIGVYGKATSNASGAAGAPARAGGYFESGSGATLAYTYVACYEGAGVPRKVMGTGTVNTIVKDDAGKPVLLSAPEAPENLFQDLGSGSLVNGRAHVALDRTLARNILVNDTHPLRAFVQLRGDCNGVFVTNATADGFDVVELRGGTSNAPFDWSISANRADEVRADGTVVPYAQERFAAGPEPQPRTALGPPVSTAVVEQGTTKAERVEATERTVVRHADPVIVHRRSTGAGVALPAATEGTAQP